MMNAYPIVLVFQLAVLAVSIPIKIIEPEDCTEIDVGNEKSARVKINVNDIDTSGFILLDLEEGDNVYTYDVPPTPFSNGQQYYLCPEAMSLHDCQLKWKHTLFSKFNYFYC
jgi:hypothetical protein